MAFRGSGITLVLGLIAGGCAAHTGQLTGSWTVAAGPGRAGFAKQPRFGQPLEIEGAGECIVAQTLDQLFGTPCKDHETEVGGLSDTSGTLSVGPHPTTGEVRWYCEGRTVIRLVLERCGTGESYRVADLAVSVGGKR
jgi:hypothetical protein